MQHFLKVFLDIVLWRRGPQDLPASALLLVLSGIAYVLVGLVQFALLEERVPAGLLFVVLDPLLLALGLWLLLGLFGHRERFLQTTTAVLGTGALLGAALFVPVQWMLGALGLGPDTTVAGVSALVLVVVFALVTGRILRLAIDSSLFTGIALSLTYVLLVNLLLAAATRGGP